MERVALRAAARFQKKAVTSSELVDTLDHGIGVLRRMRAWFTGYSQILLHADTSSLPKGWIWQDAFMDFFKEGESLQSELSMIDTSLEDITGTDATFANLARSGTSEPPRKARFDFALSVFEFFPDATGEDNIAYDMGTLQEWARGFGSWLATSTKVLQGALQKARHAT
jgi:hypothetical protein